MIRILVLRRLQKALARFYECDGQLLELDSSERSITHKLAEHMQLEFTDWQVDCEYNRRGDEPKRLLYLKDQLGEIEADDVEAKTVFPDIIVHRRGLKKNLLVVEVKKANGQKETCDLMKLSAFEPGS